MSNAAAEVFEEPGTHSGAAPIASDEPARASTKWSLGLATLAVLAASLAALVPTVGDFGLTWDEPAYRYSQVISVQWWQLLGRAASWADIQQLLDPRALLYYWPYGRYGINFHPPLAGQLNLAAHAIFGSWMKDIPSRRMASAIEFALTITIGFHFLARRYGKWVGLVMAGSLLLMPRLYGQAHLIDTDTPGLLLWTAATLAFWNGLHEPHARPWRVAVGILLGLAFVEKMAAVMVLGPLLLWLIVGYVPPTLVRRGGRSDWIDGVLTSGAMLAPLALAFQQILMLQRRLLPPKLVDHFNYGATSDWPGVILAIPLAIWLFRHCWAGCCPGIESGALSGPPWKHGRRSSLSPRSSAGSETQPGGAKRWFGWLTITRSTTNATVCFLRSRSSISVRSIFTAFPGTMAGCCWPSPCRWQSWSWARLASSGRLDRSAETGCRSISWFIFSPCP